MRLLKQPHISWTDSIQGIGVITMKTFNIDFERFDIYRSDGWLMITSKKREKITRKEVEDILDYYIKKENFHKLGIKGIYHRFKGRDYYLLKKKHIRLLDIYDEYYSKKEVKLTPFQIIQDLAIVYRGNHPRLVAVSRYEA